MGQETKSEYRGAKPLPYELRQHCAIYFEEKLCQCTSACYGCAKKLTADYCRLSSSDFASEYIILRNLYARSGICPGTPTPGACSNTPRAPLHHHESEIKRGERLS